MFELITKMLAAFFDHLSVNEWEKGIFFIFLELIFVISLELFLALHHFVRHHEVIIQRSFAEFFPLVLQFLQVGYLLQEFLFSVELIFLCCVSMIHFISHLFKMLLHHLVRSGFLIIVHLSAKSDDLLEWVSCLVEMLISDFAHALEPSTSILGIRIGHME